MRCYVYFDNKGKYYGCEEYKNIGRREERQSIYGYDYSIGSGNRNENECESFNKSPNNKLNGPMIMELDILLNSDDEDSDASHSEKSVASLLLELKPKDQKLGELYAYVTLPSRGRNDNKNNYGTNDITESSWHKLIKYNVFRTSDKEDLPLDINFL
ncbi:hypothetical protein K502DRAFT_347462 [Neoconidiobolus thromboides FSU 785]|nr:hypothetical protein K502DRAFT_347462 [Neoconidiobolus thromboides FSU 785]